MTASTLFLYITACLAVTIIPGPTMLLALSNGSTRNGWVVAAGMMGAMLSDLILIGAVGAGMGALLMASEKVFSMARVLGCGYLMWLAVELWRSQPVELGAGVVMVRGDGRRAFMRSLLVALSNPKGLLFFSAFLPRFIDTTRPQAGQYLGLAVVTAILDALVMTGYALGGAQTARWLTAKGLRRLNRTCASALVVMAVGLAFFRKSRV